MLFFKKKKDQDSIKYRMTPRQVEAIVDEQGILQVAGCLPIDTINKRFLLVTSATHPDAWVIPKGSWDTDETQKQAAMRETWEEAGVKGTIKRHIGVFAEKAKEGVRAHHSIYEMEIKQVAKKFPEQSLRERRWFSYEDAMAAVKAHYVKDAISMSSLSPLVHPEDDGEKKKKKKKKKEQEEEDTGEEDKKKKKKDEKEDEDEDKKEKKKKKKKDEDEDEENEDKKEKKKKKEDEDEDEDKKKKKKKKEDEEGEGDEDKKEKKKKKKEKKQQEDVDKNGLGEEVVADEDNTEKKKKKESEITELTDEEIVRIQLQKLEANPELEK